MEYLATISKDNHIVFIETKDITRINLMQQIRLVNREGTYYIVIIDHRDGFREQAVISDETWKYWNENNN